MSQLNEEIVELAALEWLAEIGYQTRFGPNIAPGETANERHSYNKVLLNGRLHSAYTATIRNAVCKKWP